MLHIRVEMRRTKGRVCRTCGVEPCHLVVFRVATPSMLPFALFHVCRGCSRVLRDVFRRGVGSVKLSSGRVAALMEENADMTACRVCALEAVTHGLRVDGEDVLQMCAHCRTLIRNTLMERDLAAESSLPPSFR